MRKEQKNPELEKAENELEKAEEKFHNAVGYLFLGGKVDGKSRRGIINILEGKKGLIRGHLAGKRADYSGRCGYRR
jgi:DNA-directed RNA polymerase beta' subunit